MASLPPLTSPQADALAGKVLRHCVDAGVLPDPGPPPAGGDGDLWDEFHRLRTHLTPRVNVPVTALTPLLARVLFGAGAMARPERVAVLGCYAGNLMMWLTARGFGPHARYAGRSALGVDVDGEAVALARGNADAAGFRNTDLRTHDAFRAEELMAQGGAADSGRKSGFLDALLIDIDEPVKRKTGYLALLEKWLPFLAPGALVIAHDVVHPRFAAGMKGYLDFVSGPGFAASTTLPVDECGVALSRLHDGPPRR